MIINDLDGYYIVFDTKNWNTELDTLVTKAITKTVIIINFFFITVIKENVTAMSNEWHHGHG